MDNKNAIGRPRKYDDKYCQEIIDYFNVEPMQVKYYDGCDKPVVTAVDFPTMAGFASKIGVHRETLMNWCKLYPDFFDSYNRAKELQEKILVINGLNGNYNSNFAKFVATNYTGLRDIKQVESTNLNFNMDRNDEEDKSLDDSITEFLELKKQYDDRRETEITD